MCVNHFQQCPACGEPPLLLAASVHCAVRAAINAAREDVKSTGQDCGSIVRLDSPACIDKVKAGCGFDGVEHYLLSLVATEKSQLG